MLPDSPVSLIERGHLEKARKVLSRVRGVEDVDEEFQDIVEAARVANMVKRPWRNIIRSQYRCASSLPGSSCRLGCGCDVVCLPCCCISCG